MQSGLSQLKLLEKQAKARGFLKRFSSVALKPDQQLPLRLRRGHTGVQQRRYGESWSNFGLLFRENTQVCIPVRDGGLRGCEFRVHYGRKSCPDATGMVRPPTNTSVTALPESVA